MSIGQTKHFSQGKIRQSMTWPPQEVRCTFEPSHHTTWWKIASTSN